MVVFWPKIYLNMINQCPKAQDCTPYGTILKNFQVLCTQNDLKKIFRKYRKIFRNFLVYFHMVYNLELWGNDWSC